MISWIFLAAAYWVLTVICWLTTPVVVLFCSNEGELPCLLRGWQTWDTSCDESQEVLEEAPDFLRYDWHSKYYKFTDTIRGTGRTRDYTCLYPGATFSLWERFQRYCCRCLWLWRNPAYGFAFYLLGRDVDLSAMKWATSDGYRAGYDQTDKSINAAWCIKDDRYITDNVRKSWYLGWKIPQDGDGVVRCMLAARLSVRV